MPTLLVTGGCGFIGSNFVRHLLATDPAVSIINFDSLTYAGNLANGWKCIPLVTSVSRLWVVSVWVSPNRHESLYGIFLHENSGNPSG